MKSYPYTPKPVFVVACELRTWRARHLTWIRADPVLGQRRIAAVVGERILSQTRQRCCWPVYCAGVRATWGGPEKYSLMLKPKVASSLIAPPMIGIWLYCPVVQAVSGWMGMMVPSTNGPCYVWAICIGCSLQLEDPFGRQATQTRGARTAGGSSEVIAPGQCSRGCWLEETGNGAALVDRPLNSPAAPGDIKFAAVSGAPADWPPSATLLGSPPKAAILACTQRSAAC